MALDNEKFVGEGLTYDDVLLVPSYSNVLPRETSLKTKFSRHIDLNIPVVSAGMDTVTESRMAIAIAQEGGIGVLHKNMTIGKQAAEVRKVKRAENGMISDPVTIHVDATVKDALDLMSEYHIGGIPVVDSQNKLVGIVTNRDLRFERGLDRPIKTLSPPPRCRLRRLQTSYNNTKSRNCLWSTRTTTSSASSLIKTSLR